MSFRANHAPLASIRSRFILNLHRVVSPSGAQVNEAAVALDVADRLAEGEGAEGVLGTVVGDEGGLAVSACTQHGQGSSGGQAEG